MRGRGFQQYSSPKGGPTRRNVEQLLLKLVLSDDRGDVKDFVLLQILYQLSKIWYPSSVSGVSRHLFKYVDSIKQYEGDVNQSLFDKANEEKEDPPTRRASPQPFFTDINKESEDAPPGEVPPPENYHIDMTLEAGINEGEKVSRRRRSC
ncbi:uncharacterized protein A4U43_C05F24900 [Asparagus officinalis]|uniref:Uncharacterized protein n=1 Tax=Asparagus officinalis TaxID=4686 RepID=A0A5P1EYL8_ASPOF|nr:uncharacterized protein A4U43_C05F24900 [Asparagus officinalis]